MREHFKRTVLPRHQARKKKPTKPNSQTNSSKAQSNNPNFTNDRNELLSQDDYIYKKFMTKSSREDQKSTPNNTNGTKGKIKEKRIMKNHQRIDSNFSSIGSFNNNSYGNIYNFSSGGQINQGSSENIQYVQTSSSNDLNNKNQLCVSGTISECIEEEKLLQPIQQSPISSNGNPSSSSDSDLSAKESSSKSNRIRSKSEPSTKSRKDSLEPIDDEVHRAHSIVEGYSDPAIKSIYSE